MSRKMHVLISYRIYLYLRFLQENGTLTFHRFDALKSTVYSMELVSSFSIRHQKYIYMEKKKKKKMDTV